MCRGKWCSDYWEIKTGSRGRLPTKWTRSGKNAEVWNSSASKRSFWSWNRNHLTSEYGKKWSLCIQSTGALALPIPLRSSRRKCLSLIWFLVKWFENNKDLYRYLHSEELLNFEKFIIATMKVPIPEFPNRGERAANTCNENEENRANAEADVSKIYGLADSK